MSIENVLLEKTKFFLNPLYSNATNIVKDIFIFQQKIFTKNNTWSYKSADATKTSSNLEKYISEY